MPKNDIYGRLQNHILRKLVKVHSAIRRMPTTISLSCVNAVNLEDVCQGHMFDRIEVSNIADVDYVGTAQTLRSMAPLLNAANAHATLITLYMNAVPGIVENRKGDLMETMELVRKYIPKPMMPPLRLDVADSFRMGGLLSLIGPFDKYFEKYKAKEDFKRVAAMVGLVAKQRHTVVKPWPNRLTLEADEAGATEALEALETSTHHGSEVYVEWQLEKLA